MKNWLKVTLFSLTVLIGSLGFAGFTLSMITPPTTKTVEAKPVEVKQKPLLELVNELRAEKGVHPLTASPELDASAQEKALDMANNHYFGHENALGVRGVDLIPHHLPQATRGSENLTVCVANDDNAGAFKAWLNSPAHYQGMIDPSVTLYGTATAYDEVKRCTVYVNHFAAV